MATITSFSSHLGENPDLTSQVIFCIPILVVSTPLFQKILNDIINSHESFFIKGINMRKGNKFTPQVLRKWVEGNKRGEGVLNEYRPWHQVTRSDPPSKGRSHLTFCPKLKRMRHQLSDGEQKILGFSLMLPVMVK